MVDSDSLMVLELSCLLGDSSHLGRIQRMLRKMAKAKQAMVLPEDNENVSLLLVGTGDST